MEMRFLNRILLLGFVLLPGVGFSQLELEAEGTLCYTFPKSSGIFWGDQAYPMPGLGAGVHYGFSNRNSAVAFRLGLKYSSYASFFRRELELRPIDQNDPVLEGLEEIVLRNKYYDNTFGPTLGFLINTGSDKIHAISVESGVQMMFHNRTFGKLTSDGDLLERGSHANWLGEDIAWGMLFVPTSIGFRSPLANSEHWLIAPRLTYTFISFTAHKQASARFKNGHILQLGCGFIWRK
ncbi:MAG: hypothetical protein ACOCZ8_00860 [Bacteroidota bacterium]